MILMRPVIVLSVKCHKGLKNIPRKLLGSPKQNVPFTDIYDKQKCQRLKRWNLKIFVFFCPTRNTAVQYISDEFPVNQLIDSA